MDKNKKLIIFAIIFEIPLLGMFLFATIDRQDVTNLVPGNRIMDFIFFYVLSPLIMILFIFF